MLVLGVNFGFLAIFLLTWLFIFGYPLHEVLDGLDNWDADHYDFIRIHGIRSNADLQAFFPLFPYFWRFSHLDLVGISIFNVLVYSLGFTMISLQYKFSIKEITLYLLLPSGIFFLIPYSESLFFLFSVLLLISLDKRKLVMLFISMFLSCITRPLFSIYLVSVSILALFFIKEKKFKLQSFTIMSIAIIFALLFVTVYYHHLTGEWFGYIFKQKNWGNHLQIPKTPFNSPGSYFPLISTDGISLYIGIFSLIFILYFLKNNKTIKLNNSLIFSLLYLWGISLSVLMFRGGSLYSLNRFVFSSVFVLIFLNYHQNIQLSQKFLGVIFITNILFWFLFGSYVHIQAFLNYLIPNIVIIIFLLNFTNIKLDTKLKNFSYAFLILLLLILKVTFLQMYLKNEWVA